MMNSFSKVEELLPGYLSGDLSDKDRAMMDEWRLESPENELIVQQSRKAWEAIPLLTEMEQFNSFAALKNVNTKISAKKHISWWISIQRIAAILLLPLLVYTGYLTIKSQKTISNEHQSISQTVISRPGMVSQFNLSDGTKVWLNSGSELQFPLHFNGDKREVQLKGEAFFEVTKNENHPFRVNAAELKVEVLGTSFNVVNFDDDTQSEIVLVTGKVALSSESGKSRKSFGTMIPGQRVIYEKSKKNIIVQKVEVDKYISWREGNLIFRDDDMEEVVKKLSRWYNVEMTIVDPEIKSYIYKATFRNENLIQVLTLLKLSAPIDYKITERKMLSNGEFTKQKVTLIKRKS